MSVVSGISTVLKINIAGWFIKFIELLAILISLPMGSLNESRQTFLTKKVNETILRYIEGERKEIPSKVLGLDIGAQDGKMAWFWQTGLKVNFFGLDLDIGTERYDIQMIKGVAQELPFRNSSFDIITAISVLEHIPPMFLQNSFNELFRILREGGIVIIQIPNMLFPIEPHSLLPLQQFLPKRIANWYLKTFSINRGYDGNWFVTTIHKIKFMALKAGFSEICSTSFIYPYDIYPRWSRNFLVLLKIFPSDYYVIIKKPRKLG